MMKYASTLNEIDPLLLIKIDPPDFLKFSKIVNQK